MMGECEQNFCTQREMTGKKIIGVKVKEGSVKGERSPPEAIHFSEWV
jgi:hypothetical protein